MSDKIFLNARYAFRSDTLENWQNINPVLEKGEPAIVSDGIDGEWLKIGDGINTFNDLEWKKGPKGPKGDVGTSATILSAPMGQAHNVATSSTAHLPMGSIIYVYQEGVEGFPTADVFYKTGLVGEEGVWRLLTDRYLGEGLYLDDLGGLNIDKTALSSEVGINGFTSPYLEANKVYRFDISGDISFHLPTDIDNTILNTIELQVNISNYDAISVDLGTTKHFGDIPTLGNGSYIIYYEYDGSAWCVGALPVVEEQ